MRKLMRKVLVAVGLLPPKQKFASVKLARRYAYKRILLGLIVMVVPMTLLFLLAPIIFDSRRIWFLPCGLCWLGGGFLVLDGMTMLDVCDCSDVGMAASIVPPP